METESPGLVCSLSGPEVAERRATVLRRLRALVRDTQTTDTGLLLCLDATDEALEHVFLVMRLERQCCRFLRFQLTIEPQGGPLWLLLDGPPGAREFIESELALSEPE